MSNEEEKLRHEFHKDYPVIAIKWAAMIIFIAGSIAAVYLVIWGTEPEAKEWGRTILAGVIGAALGAASMKAAH
jgi:fatty acid desaturase